MGWMNRLCDTFDNNSNLVADYTVDFPICPVAHMEATAQIEITISGKGEFLKASSITNKGEQEIFIPVSEESASRSSGNAPHALYDNLTYVAGDYARYADTKKDAITSQKRFTQYSEMLKKWSESKFSHSHIKAIYQYICQQCMIKNLVDAEVIVLNDNGKLSNLKIAGKAYEKCIVRFRVQDDGENEMQTDKCWQNKEIIRLYQEYYRESKSESSCEDICYITGEKNCVSDSHPKGIIPSSYGAKLISANDTTDFTFRGRFNTSDEAYSVGYESTQKAHNALKWLVKMSGYKVGESDNRTYICWNSKGKKVPKPDNLFGYIEEEDNENLPKNFQAYREKLKNLINGYGDYFSEDDIITIMAMEAATTGRLSIVYYNELNAKDFLERIRSWNESCCWQFKSFTAQKEPIEVVRTPSIKNIIKYTFGEHQGDNLKVNDKQMIMQYQRLFHCIADKQRLPRDFVEAIFQRANRLMNYSETQCDMLISIACALIAKYYVDYLGGEVKMGLDRTLKDRSYLYGRLLAVYEHIERRTYDYDEKRETNAIRYQTAFSQHPATTRKIIEEQLLPYYNRLSIGEQVFLKKEIEEISNMFSIEDLKDINKSLGYTYIIGYWAERAELRKGNKVEK